MPELEFLGTTTGADASELHPTLASPLQPDHMLRLSRSQEDAGFDGVLVTESSSSAHAFVLGVQVLAATTRMRVVMTVRPGITTPTSLHRILATLDAFHPNRVGFYVPPVDNDLEYHSEGDWTERGDRQERRAEFLDVVARLARAAGPVGHAGTYYRLEQAWTALRPQHDVPVYLSGRSSAADGLAGTAADVYLLPAEQTGAVRERIERVREVATRDVRFGLSLRPILGNRSDDAWRLAERVARSRRVGERHALRTATGALDDAADLIGTVPHVAATILRYAALGVSVFQLHGYAPLNDVDQHAALMALVRAQVDGTPRAEPEHTDTHDHSANRLPA